jgi:hypothetical protein
VTHSTSPRAKNRRERRAHQRAEKRAGIHDERTQHMIEHGARTLDVAWTAAPGAELAALVLESPDGGLYWSRVAAITDVLGYIDSIAPSVATHVRAGDRMRRLAGVDGLVIAFPRDASPEVLVCGARGVDVAGMNLESLVPLAFSDQPIAPRGIA